MNLRFGSVCSGIESASVAWHPLGWRAAWLSEIEPFPSAVLAHHYPDVPNLGDMTTIAARVRAGEIEAPDILVGGTPCQAFSVAGARAGLADPRGQLTIAYVDLADAIDSARALRGELPSVTVWENVPGVLSSRDNAFGCFLGALAGEGCELEPPGGKWKDAGCVFGPTRAIAWRVLDAQYFGLAQRRRRVFVVSSARPGFNPAAVLFEFEGVRRDTAPADKKEGLAEILVCGCGYEFQDSLGEYGCPNCEGDNGPAVARDSWWDGKQISQTLDAVLYKRQTLPEKNRFPAVMQRCRLRFITTTEAERLQGFPDGYTLVTVRNKPAADGPRYKALGNSKAVPVVRWIGRRIDAALHAAAGSIYKPVG